MKKLLITSIDFLFKPLYGKRQFQSLFGLLFSISIKGFNLRHRPIDDNGELWVIKQLHKYYGNREIKPLIFDVGANEGQYADVLIRNFGDNVQLHCFEPLDRTFQLLFSKFTGFPFISMHSFGLGDNAGILTFFVSSKDSTLNSLYSKRRNSINNYDGKSEIEIKRLSEFCAEESISHIHFMKIDVEGNELAVLKGGENLLHNQQIDFIQFEFGSRNIDARTYFEDFYNLLNEKYLLFRIMRNGLYPMPVYNYDYEIFAIGNYLAISRKINSQDFLSNN